VPGPRLSGSAKPTAETMTEWASSGRDQLRAVRESPGADQAAAIAVNGSQSHRLVGGIERPFGEAERAPAIAGSSAHCPYYSNRLCNRAPLRGPASHLWSGPQDKRPVLACKCEEVGCWPLMARISVGRGHRDLEPLRAVSSGGTVRYERLGRLSSSAERTSRRWQHWTLRREDGPASALTNRRVVRGGRRAGRGSRLDVVRAGRRSKARWPAGRGARRPGACSRRARCAG